MSHDLSTMTFATIPKDTTFTVFVHEGVVYTSPTRNQFPPKGPPPAFDVTDSTSIPPSGTWWYCMWGKREYLELAFYPTSTRPVGSAFRCLHFHRRDKVPVEVRQPQPNGCKQYRTPYADEWKKLKITLIHVQNLLQNHRIVPVLVGLDKIFVRWPSSERYEDWVTDPAVAQRKAFFAQRKFLYLVSLLSFHIAALWTRSGDPNLWRDYLQENGVSGSILDSLSGSVVADFTRNTPRAGIFIKPEECTWKQYLSVLILANVPVFVCWGPVKSPIAAPQGFGALKPTSRDITAAHELSTSISAVALSATDASTNVPAFLPSDTPGKFFAIRATYRDACIKLETAEERLARLAREKCATKYQITRYGEDKVFEWDFPRDRLWWTRVRVERKDLVSVWDEYDNRHRRYDPVTQEWDLAFFLDDSGAGDAHDAEDLDDQEDNDRSSNLFFREGDYILDPPAPPGVDTDEVRYTGDSETMTFESFLQSVTPARPPGTTMIPHVASAKTSWLPSSSTAWMLPETPAPMTTDPEDGEIASHDEWCPRFPVLDAVLMPHHLFRWGVADLPMPVNKPLSWSDACRAVGFLPTPELKRVLDSGKPDGSTHFARWVYCVINSIALPADWCLLSPNLAATGRLRDLLRDAGLRIFHIDDLYAHVRLWCLDDRGNARYMRTWFVAVDNPSTALAAAMSTRSIDEAVRWMVGLGIKFRTIAYSARATRSLKEGQERNTRNTQVPPNLLLLRPANHQFSPLDYHTYVDFRHYYLQTHPRAGRAVLLAGGILWRLVIETVEPDLVLDGPDSLSAALEVTFALRDINDNVFVDDKLTADEVRIIVGAYVREPAQRKNLAGVGYPSWWPDAAHFHESALDFGWWSPVTEAWYCDLRAAYRRGQAQPKTGNQWRDVMKNRDKRARMFTQSSKEAASKFLRGVST